MSFEENFLIQYANNKRISFTYQGNLILKFYTFFKNKLSFFLCKHAEGAHSNDQLYFPFDFMSIGTININLNYFGMDTWDNLKYLFRCMR